MALNIGNQIAVLQRMTVGQLREKYEDVFGETTRAGILLAHSRPMQ